MSNLKKSKLHVSFIEIDSFGYIKYNGHLFSIYFHYDSEPSKYITMCPNCGFIVYEYGTYETIKLSQDSIIELHGKTMMSCDEFSIKNILEE